MYLIYIYIYIYICKPFTIARFLYLFCLNLNNHVAYCCSNYLNDASTNSDLFERAFQCLPLQYNTLIILLCHQMLNISYEYCSITRYARLICLLIMMVPISTCHFCTGCRGVRNSIVS